MAKSFSTNDRKYRVTKQGLFRNLIIISLRVERTDFYRHERPFNFRNNDNNVAIL